MLYINKSKFPDIKKNSCKKKKINKRISSCHPNLVKTQFVFIVQHFKKIFTKKKKKKFNHFFFLFFTNKGK